MLKDIYYFHCGTVTNSLINILSSLASYQYVQTELFDYISHLYLEYYSKCDVSDISFYLSQLRIWVQ